MRVGPLIVRFNCYFQLIRDWKSICKAGHTMMDCMSATQCCVFISLFWPVLSLSVCPSVRLSVRREFIVYLLEYIRCNHARPYIHLRLVRLPIINSGNRIINSLYYTHSFVHSFCTRYSLCVVNKQTTYRCATFISTSLQYNVHIVIANCKRYSLA